MPRYGIVAAAVVTVASEVLILIGSYPLMRRYFGFFPRAAHAGAGGLGRRGMGLTVWLLDAAPLPVLVALGAAIYGGLLWALSPASRELVTGLRRT